MGVAIDLWLILILFSVRWFYNYHMWSALKEKHLII